MMPATIRSAAMAACVAAVFSTPAEARQCGAASWYAMTSRTASGERMDPKAMTAAHRTMDFGTRLQVTNPRNGKTVIVRVNDRGPFTRGRVLDLSRAAAQELGFVRAGHARLCFSPLG